MAHENSERGCYSIASFCKAHEIARGTFYNLLKAGQGPRIAKVGTRTLITIESAKAWRASLDGEVAA